jgi:hypothetical protein
MTSKPLGQKNYGSIAHLPRSRMGPGEHACHEGQARIATQKVRDKHDLVIVQEKLDGSNVGIANIDGKIFALGRSGYLAQTSRFEQHQIFAAWVRDQETFWAMVIPPGKRLVGEWLAQAHSTRYSLPDGPFVAFDLMSGTERSPFDQVRELCEKFAVPMPKLLHVGGALAIEQAMELHGDGSHGCLDEPEGAVWRVERKGKVDFLVKFVRPDKIDGKFLPEISGAEAIWNWRP